jgi:hypothetical protein
VEGRWRIKKNKARKAVTERGRKEGRREET